MPVPLLDRLRQQAEATAEGPGRRRLEGPEADFVQCLLELCRVLAASLGLDLELSLQEAWTVTQLKGDYFPLRAERASTRQGFACIMDITLPPCLSCENHERPPAAKSHLQEHEYM